MRIVFFEGLKNLCKKDMFNFWFSSLIYVLVRSHNFKKLVEIPMFNREFSVCCGGGAMGLWRDWPEDERLENFRLEQIMNTGAEILAVACPYCLLHSGIGNRYGNAYNRCLCSWSGRTGWSSH